MKTFFIGAIVVLILATGGWWYKHTTKAPITEVVSGVKESNAPQTEAAEPASSKSQFLTIDGRTLRGTAVGFDRVYILIQGLKNTPTEGRERQLLVFVMQNNTWNVSVDSYLSAGKYTITVDGMRPGEATGNKLEESVYTLSAVEEKALYIDKALHEDSIEISAQKDIEGSLLKGWVVKSAISGKKFELKDTSGFIIGPGEWTIFIHTVKDPNYSYRAVEGEIHMYFNESEIAWGDEHDTIQLLDSKGRVVDTILY